MLRLIAAWGICTNIYRIRGVLDVAMHVKSTAQGAALSSLSAHVPSIHDSWPISRLLHYNNVVSHAYHFRIAAHKLFHKILASDPTHPSLVHIANAISHGRPVRNETGGRDKRPCTRLVLPYHASLRDLPRRLYKLRRVFRDRGMLDFVPKVAWSLGDPNLACVCNRDSFTKIGNYSNKPGR